jgi:hypothetical protein
MTNKRERLIAGLLLATAAIYGIVPPLVDLSATHALHPDWPPHARFHMVWLLATNSALAAIVSWLVLAGGNESRLVRLRLASLLGVAALGGFVIATLAQGAYGGALSDPTGGVPPILGLDGNLLGFTPAFLAQLAAVWMAHREQS